LSNNASHELIIVLDFGSQYTQLIARRVRESGVYCEILPFNATGEQIYERRPKGLILSGGPASVYAREAPRPMTGLFEESLCPMLGICYGLQLMAASLGGSVQASEKHEYGFAQLSVIEPLSPLFEGLPPTIDVWMSHGDQVTAMPADFRLTATTDKALNGFESLSKGLFGIQFHPEVAHTAFGLQILKNFLFNVCHCQGDWSPVAVIRSQIDAIRQKVGTNEHVICGLSGGVDSTVAASLVNEAIGNRQRCIFIDNGLLRDGEYVSTLSLLKQSMNLSVYGVKAEKRFLDALHDVVDPELKRKIIGHTFVEVFDEEASRLGDVKYLVQGTLYPDVIESVSVNGPSAVIKSHHNVGGLPEHMKLELIEPLRELFKDEVRIIGRELGVPEEILQRHPFPGPGLAVRILGEVTAEHVRLLQTADRILDEELRLANLYQAVWQAFPVLLPISTVGVMGDARTYERVLAIRAVSSLDGMTADWARLPHDVLARISSRLTSEVRGINRVVYDISSKPPSTIEWE